MFNRKANDDYLYFHTLLIPSTFLKRQFYLTDIIRWIIDSNRFWISCICYSWFYNAEWSEVWLDTFSLFHFYHIYGWHGFAANSVHFDLWDLSKKSERFQYTAFPPSIWPKNLPFYSFSTNFLSDTRNIVGNYRFIDMDIHGFTRIFISTDFKHVWCYAYFNCFVYNIHSKRIFWSACSAWNAWKVSWRDNGSFAKMKMTNAEIFTKSFNV